MPSGQGNGVQITRQSYAPPPDFALSSALLKVRQCRLMSGGKDLFWTETDGSMEEGTPYWIVQTVLRTACHTVD